MKRKLLLTLMIIPLIGCGCNRNDSELVLSGSSVSQIVTTSNIETTNSINTTSEASNSITSINTTLTSINVTSKDSTPISSTSEEIYSDLALIKEKARGLKESINDLNVAESTMKVSLSLKLLARIDMITSKSGMGNRYKLLMSDGQDYIYVKVNDVFYNKVENRINSTFDITGTISLYCGQEEITCDNVFSLSTKEITLGDIFEKISLKDAYDYIDNLDLNNKGCIGGKLASISVKYLAKMDNSIGLFYDGTYVIQVHGKSNFMSGMKIGNSYDINGAINMFNFRPSFEYYSFKNNDNLIIPSIDRTKLEKIDASIYNIKYEVDKEKKYPSYTNLFKKLRIVEGYVNYYIKDNKYYTVIEFINKDEVYSMYQNASSAKALFIKNDSATNLMSEQDMKYNQFDKYFTGEKIEVIVTPYLWNTLKYWQVYALEDTISVVNV